MKKFVIFVLCTIVAVCQAYAQEQNEVMFQDTTRTQNSVEQNVANKDVTAELINALAKKMLDENDVYDPLNTRVSVPIQGKSRFARRHLIYQELGISTIAGKDKDMDSDDSDGDSKGSGSKLSGLPDLQNQLNFGLNVDYTLKFVPGTIKGDMLELNRMGFAYSLGLVAAFDHQDKYEVTCDFMGKFGVETGNNHPLGVGFDALVGTGKSSGSLYFIDDADDGKNDDDDDDDDDDDPIHYTAWCFKFGGQFWVKTNLLTSGLKNTDILLFARFVYSVDPHNDKNDNNVISIWNEESWSFGVTLRYRF